MERVKQKGFLIILAIFIVVILSIFAVAVTTKFTYQSRSGTKELHSGQALNVAMGGLQRGMALYLNNDTFCDGTTQSAEAFGDGEFKLTCTTYNTDSRTLAANISSSNSIIPVSSLTGLAPSGQIRVGNELIEYYQTATTATQCNVETCGGSACTAPCLLGAVRAVGSSSAASHSSGSTIEQYELVIKSDGVVPSFSNILAERVVEKAFSRFYNEGSGKSAWVIGGKSLNDMNVTEILGWTGGGWEAVSIPQSQTLRAIACASNSACWAGGRKDQNLLSWNGSTWSEVSTGDIDDVLSMVCPSGNRCFAGGSKDTYLLDWNGTSWSRISTEDIDNVNALACPSSTQCFAGGDKVGYLLDWNGTAWSRISTSSIDAVHAITCPTPTKCFAGGARGQKLLEWDGSSWSLITTGNVGEVASIGCASSNLCWAGGTKGKSLLQWNGSTWSLITTPNIGEVKTITCAMPGLCFVGGTDDDQLLEWNGLSWALVSGSTASLESYAAATLPPANSIDYVSSQGWHERFSEA